MPGAEGAFVAPATLSEALEALAAPGAMLLGGGTAMALLMKSGLVEPSALVYIAHLPELSGLRVAADGLHVGAATTLRELARDATVHAQIPALADAASKVGNPRVRAVATVGGAVAHGDPRQDLPAVLLAADANVIVTGRGGTRSVPLSGILVGFMETSLAEDEVITEVVVPPRANRRLHYSRFTPNSEDDYPTVGVAVALERDPSGLVIDARIALGGVAPTAVLAAAAARTLVGTRPGATLIAQVGDEAAAAVDPSEDARGSAAYKREMVAVWTRRTIAACLSA